MLLQNEDNLAWKVIEASHIGLNLFNVLLGQRQLEKKVDPLKEIQYKFIKVVK